MDGRRLDHRGRFASAFVLLALIAALAGCGSSGNQPTAETPVLNPVGEVTAICREANGRPHATFGPGPRDWREQAMVAGPVGVQDHTPPLSFMSGDRKPGLVTKMPILVSGQRPVRVGPDSETGGRIALYFGPERSFSTNRGAASVLFKPCRDRRSTVFPGGIRIVGDETVTLRVTRPADAQTWILPLGKPERLSTGK